MQLSSDVTPKNTPTQRLPLSTTVRYQNNARQSPFKNSGKLPAPTDIIVSPVHPLPIQSHVFLRPSNSDALCVARTKYLLGSQFVDIEKIPVMFRNTQYSICDAENDCHVPFLLYGHIECVDLMMNRTLISLSIEPVDVTAVREQAASDAEQKSLEQERAIAKVSNQLALLANEELESARNNTEQATTKQQVSRNIPRNNESYSSRTSKAVHSVVPNDARTLTSGGNSVFKEQVWVSTADTFLLQPRFPAMSLQEYSALDKEPFDGYFLFVQPDRPVNFLVASYEGFSADPHAFFVQKGQPDLSISELANPKCITYFDSLVLQHVLVFIEEFLPEVFRITLTTEDRDLLAKQRTRKPIEQKPTNKVRKALEKFVSGTEQSALAREKTSLLTAMDDSLVSLRHHLIDGDRDASSKIPIERKISVVQVSDAVANGAASMLDHDISNKRILLQRIDAFRVGALKEFSLSLSAALARFLAGKVNGLMNSMPIPSGIFLHKVPSSSFYNRDSWPITHVRNEHKMAFSIAHEQLAISLIFTDPYIRNVPPFLSTTKHTLTKVLHALLNIPERALTSYRCSAVPYDKICFSDVTTVHSITRIPEDKFSYIYELLNYYLTYLATLLHKAAELSVEVDAHKKHSLYKQAVDYYFDADLAKSVFSSLQSELRVIWEFGQPQTIEQLIDEHRTVFTANLKLYTFLNSSVIPFSLFVITAIVYLEDARNEVVRRIVSLAEERNALSIVASNISAAGMYKKIGGKGALTVKSASEHLTEIVELDGSIMDSRPHSRIPSPQKLDEISSRQLLHPTKVFITIVRGLTGLLYEEYTCVLDAIDVYVVPETPRHAASNTNPTHIIRDEFHAADTSPLDKMVTRMRSLELFVSPEYHYSLFPQTSVLRFKVIGSELQPAQSIIDLSRFHFCFLDILLTYLFQIPIACVRGTDWTLVEETNFADLHFIQLSALVQRYQKAKFVMATSMADAKSESAPQAGPEPTTTESSVPQPVNTLLLQTADAPLEVHSDLSMANLVKQTDRQMSALVSQPVNGSTSTSTIELSDRHEESTEFPKLRNCPCSKTYERQLASENSCFVNALEFEDFDYATSDIYLTIPSMLSTNIATVMNQKDADGESISTTQAGGVAATQSAADATKSYMPSSPVHGATHLSAEHGDCGAAVAAPTSDVLLSDYRNLLIHGSQSYISVVERTFLTRKELLAKSSHVSSTLSLAIDFLRTDFTTESFEEQYNLWKWSSETLKTALSLGDVDTLGSDMGSILKLHIFTPASNLILDGTPLLPIVDGVQALRTVISIFPESLYCYMICCDLTALKRHFCHGISSLLQVMKHDVSKASAAITTRLLKETASVDALVTSAAASPDKFHTIGEISKLLTRGFISDCYQSVSRTCEENTLQVVTLFPLENNLLDLVDLKAHMELEYKAKLEENEHKQRALARNQRRRERAEKRRLYEEKMRSLLTAKLGGDIFSSHKVDSMPTAQVDDNEDVSKNIPSTDEDPLHRSAPSPPTNDGLRTSQTLNTESINCQQDIDNFIASRRAYIECENKRFLDRSIQPMVDFVSLCRAVLRNASDVNNRILQYTNYIVKTDLWIADLSYKISTGFKEVFQMTYQDFMDSKDAPLVFAEKFPIITKDFVVPHLNLDCDDLLSAAPADPGVSTTAVSLMSQAVENGGSVNSLAHLRETSLRSQHQSSSIIMTYERDFLQSLVLGTLLPIQSKRFSHEALLQGCQKQNFGSSLGVTRREEPSMTGPPQKAHSSKRLPTHARMSKRKDGKNKDDGAVASGASDDESLAFSQADPGRDIFTKAGMYLRPVFTQLAAYDDGVDGYDAKHILGEYKYLLYELSSLIEVVQRWREYLLAANMSDKLLLVPLYPSPLSMLETIAPLAEITMTLYDIHRTHTAFSCRSLRFYPHESLLVGVERCSLTIKHARDCTALELIPVSTNKNSSVLMAQTVLKKKASVSAQSEGESPSDASAVSINLFYDSLSDEAFTVSYRPWADYLEKVEQVLTFYIAPITLLHVISSPDLQPIHYSKISTFSGIFIDNNLTVNTEDVLRAFEANNTLLDFALVLSQNASIDREAIRQLKTIERTLAQLKIETVFSLPIVNQSTGRKIDYTQWYAMVDIPVVTPANAEVLCRESLVTLTQVLRNVRYSGNPEALRTTDFDKNLALIASHSALSTARHLESMFESHRDYLQQWRHSRNVEQYARDLEAACLLTLFALECMKRLPFLLYDVMIVSNLGNIVEFTGEEHGMFETYQRELLEKYHMSSGHFEVDTHTDTRHLLASSAALPVNVRKDLERKMRSLKHRKPFQLNILSPYELQMAQSAAALWKDILNKNCRSKAASSDKSGAYNAAAEQALPFMQLVSNLQVIKHLAKTVTDMDTIHRRLYMKRDYYPIRFLTTTYNEARNVEENTFEYIYSVPTSNPAVLSTVPKRLLPWRNDRHYPSALLFTTSIFLNYGEFPAQRTCFKQVPSVASEIFYGLDDVILEDSPVRGRIISGLVSSYETLMFVQPLRCPGRNYFLPDDVEAEMRPAIIACCKKAWEELQPCYDRFMGKSAADEANDETHAPERDDSAFDDYIHDNLFCAIVVAFATLIKQQNNAEIYKAFLGKSDTTCFSELLDFLHRMQTVLQANGMKKHPVFTKALLLKVQEWGALLLEVRQLYATCKGLQIAESTLVYPMIYYDAACNNVFVSTNMGKFTAGISNHWLGAPSVLDTIVKLSSRQLCLLTPALAAMTENLPVFLLSGSEKGHCNPDLYLYTTALSRYTFRRLIFMPLSEYTFVRNMQRACTALIAGYIVVIIGAELLPAGQILELVALSDSMRARSGPLPSLLVVDKQANNPSNTFSKASQLSSQSQEMNYIHTQIYARTADFSDFNNIGSLIFFIPEMQSISTAKDFMPVPVSTMESLGNAAIEVGETFGASVPAAAPVAGAPYRTANTSDTAASARDAQPPRVSDQYGHFYSLSPAALRVVSAFKHRAIVSIEIENPVLQFISASPEFGKAFFEVSAFLRTQGPSVGKLMPADIGLIYSRVKERTDATAVAAVTLDILLRQNILLTLDTRLSQGAPAQGSVDSGLLEADSLGDFGYIPQLYAQFISAAFGLDRVSSAQLQKLASSFWNYIETSLIHLGFRTQQDKSDTSSGPPHKSVSFFKYYSEGLTRYMNPQFLYYISMFSSVHQLPLQCIFDILLANDLVKSGKPVLVVSPQTSYLRIFACILSSVKNWDLSFVISNRDLQSFLRSMQSRDLQAQIAASSAPGGKGERMRDQLVVIAPASASQLRLMMDQLIGLSLHYPVVPDEFNLTYYQYEVTRGPYYLVALTPSLVTQVLADPSLSLFAHRVCLLPALEGADGNRKIIQGSLVADPARLFGVAQRYDNLWSDVLDSDGPLFDDVRFYSSSASYPEALLSPAFGQLLKSYRSKMLSSRVKDGLLLRAERRCAAYPSWLKSIVSFFYDVLTKVFGIGRSLEEVLIIRSTIFFCLHRYGVVQVCRRKCSSDYIAQSLEQMAASDGDAPGQSFGRIRALLAKRLVSEGYDSLSRSSTFFYLQLYQAKMAAAAKAAKAASAAKAPAGAAAEVSANPGRTAPSSRDYVEDTAKAAADRQTKAFYLDQLTINRTLVVDDMQIYGEQAGFLPRDMQALEAQVKRLSAAKQSLNEVISVALLSNAENDVPKAGAGLNGSLLYELSQKFLQEAVFLAEDMTSAFIHFAVPLFAASWNAFSLFYTIFANSGNWAKLQGTGPGSVHRRLGRMYLKCLSEVEDVQKVSQATFCGLTGILVLILHEEGSPALKRGCVSSFTVQKPLSLSTLDHGLGTELLMKSIRATIRVVLQSVPKAYAADVFSYIDYRFGVSRDKKSKEHGRFFCRTDFRPYMVGEGILDNLSLEDDKASLLQASEAVANRVYDLRRKELHEKFESLREQHEDDPSSAGGRHPQRSADQSSARQDTPKISKKRRRRTAESFIYERDKGARVSVQGLAPTTISLDPHRCAVVTALGCAMLVPLSLAVVGPRASGKSVLVDCAKLLVRDLIDTSFIPLSDSSSHASSYSTMSALASRFIRRNCGLACSERYDGAAPDASSDAVILDYYLSPAFPSFHVHVSDSTDPTVSDQLALLARDHVLYLERPGDMFTVDSYDMPFRQSVFTEFLQSTNAGAVTLSDFSLVIEGTPDNSLAQFASLTLAVPPITEAFTKALCRRLFAGQSDSWISSFVSGYFLIKGSLPQSVSGNFFLFAQMAKNMLFTVNRHTFFDPGVLEQVECYDTVGKKVDRALTDASVSRVVRNNNDFELCVANIHAFFGALRGLGNISPLVLDSVAERFASLSLLGYLEDAAQGTDSAGDRAGAPASKRLEDMHSVVLQTLANDSGALTQSSPWSDAKLLISGNFVLYPAWEAYIINLAVGAMSAKLRMSSGSADADEQAPAQGSGTAPGAAAGAAGGKLGPDTVPGPDRTKLDVSALGNPFSEKLAKTQNVLEACKTDTPLEVLSKVMNRDVLIALEFLGMNGFWYAHIMNTMRVFGQSMDPFIVGRAFELFLLLSFSKERNTSAANCVLSFGTSIRNPFNVSGVLAEDPHYTMRTQILREAIPMAHRLRDFFRARRGLPTIESLVQQDVQAAAEQRNNDDSNARSPTHSAGSGATGATGVTGASESEDAAGRKRRPAALDLRSHLDEPPNSLTVEKMIFYNMEQEAVERSRIEAKLHADSDNEDDEFDNDTIAFGGFTLSSVFALRPAKFSINISNAPAQTYNRIVQLLATLGCYDILSSENFKTALVEMNKATDVVDTAADFDEGRSEVSKGSRLSRGSRISSLSGSSAASTSFGLASAAARRRIIIDVNTILSGLDGQSAAKKSSSHSGTKKSKSQTEVDAMDIVGNLQRMMSELSASSVYTGDALDFLSWVMVLRVGFALALGIRPDAILASTGTKLGSGVLTASFLNTGLHITSALATGLPCRTVGTGRALSMLPASVVSWGEYTKRLQAYRRMRARDDLNRRDSDEEDSAEANDHARPARHNNENERIEDRETVLARYVMQEPFDVLIAVPKSVLNRLSPTGVSAYTLLCRSLEPTSIMSGLFDEEELAAICALTAYKAGIDCCIDRRTLSAFLSRTLSVVIIEDSPVGAKVVSSKSTFVFTSEREVYAELRTELAATIKSPVLELLQNLDEGYKALMTANAAHSSLQRGSGRPGQESGSVNGVAPAPPPAPPQIQNRLEMLTRHRKEQCRNNTLHLSFVDIMAVFKLSECQLPREITLPQKVEIKWVPFTQTFIIACIAVYKYNLEKASAPCVSMATFSLLAARICDAIVTKVQRFMSDLNALFVAYRLYDALSAPSRTKPKIVEINNLTIENISTVVTNIIKAATKQTGDSGSGALLGKRNANQHMSAASKRQYDIQVAVAEACGMRDVLHTVIESLKNDFKIMAEAARTAHLDAIATAACLCFSVTGIVSPQIALDTVASGHFGDMPEELTSLVPQSRTDARIHSYNLFILAIINSTGIPVRHPNVSKRVYGPESENYMCLGNATLSYGHSTFPGHVIEVLGRDLTTFMMLKGYKIAWTPGDPAMLAMFSAAIHNEVGTTIFCVPENLGLATASLLEAEKKRVATNGLYYRTTAQVIEERASSLAEGAKTPTMLLVSEMQKRVSVIDLLFTTREFCTSLARAISTGETSILFVNFGSPHINTSNLATLRKFMTLRSRRVIGKRQTISIGAVAAVTAQVLHKYTILFALASGANYAQALNQTGLLTQAFVDSCGVCCNYGNVGATEEQCASEGEAYFRQSVTQGLVEAVFGENESVRSRTERSRVTNIACSSLISMVSGALRKYLSYNVLSAGSSSASGPVQPQQAQSTDDGDAGEYARMNHTVSQLIATPEACANAVLAISFILNSSSSQREELGQLLGLFKGLVTAEVSRFAILSSTLQDHGKDVDRALTIKCVYYALISSVGTSICENVALAITSIISLMREFMNYHTPFVGMCTSDLLNGIKHKVASAARDFEARLMERYTKELQVSPDSLSEEQMRAQGLVSLKTAYPLVYCIKTEPATFKKFIVGASLPAINERIFSLCEKSFGSGVWILVTIIFFSLTEIVSDDTHHVSASDSLGDSDSVKPQICEYLALARILSATTQDLERLITVQQIANALLPSSKFNIRKLFSAAKLSHLEDLNNIALLTPEITSMSPRIQYAWLVLNVLARYNPLLRETLSWFLSHHSSFVTLAQCDHPFAAIITYYNAKNKSQGRKASEAAAGAKQPSALLELVAGGAPCGDGAASVAIPSDAERREPDADFVTGMRGKKAAESIITSWWSDALRRASAGSDKIISLPPVLATPSFPVFFSVFVLSLALRPEQVSDTVEAFSTLLAGLSGPSARVLQVQAAPDAEFYNSGIIRPDNRVPSEGEKYKLACSLTECMSRYLRMLLKLCGFEDTSVRDTGPGAEPDSPRITLRHVVMPELLISDACFTLYDTVLAASAETMRYKQRLADLLKPSECILEKRAQLIATLGPTPTSVTLVFYDESVAADILLRFVHLATPSLGAPIQFLRTPTLEDFASFCVVLSTDPAYDGFHVVEHASSILLQKRTVHRYKLINPIFILIPSSPCAQTVTSASDTGGVRATPHQLRRFCRSLLALANTVEPTYAYLQTPRSLHKAFVHSLDVAIASLAVLVQQRFAGALPLERDAGGRLLGLCNVLSLRGLVVLFLRQAALSVRSNSRGSDYTIFSVVRRVVTQTFSAFSTKTRLDLANFGATAMTDSGLLRLDPDAAHDLCDARFLATLDRQLIKAVFAMPGALDILLPRVLAVAQRVDDSKLVLRRMKDRLKSRVKEKRKRAAVEGLVGSDQDDAGADEPRSDTGGGEDLSASSEALSSSSASLTASSASSLSRSQSLASSRGRPGDLSAEDDEFLGVDDDTDDAASVSVAGQSSAGSIVSRATSFLTATKAGGKGAGHGLEAEEESLYASLLLGIQLVSSDALEDREVNAAEIERSVARYIEPPGRRLVEVDGAFVSGMLPASQDTLRGAQAFAVPTAFPTLQTLLDFVLLMKSLDTSVVALETNADLAGGALAAAHPGVARPKQFLQRMLGQEGVASVYRALANTQFAQSLAGRLENPLAARPSAAKIRSMDLAHMPLVFKVYIQNLRNSADIRYGTAGKALPGEEVLRGILGTASSTDTNMVDGTRAFRCYADHWILNGRTFAPVLGDILNYLKVFSALATSTPLSRQRVVATIRKPLRAPRILDDGSVDIGYAKLGAGAGAGPGEGAPGKERMMAQQYFYLVVRGFELVGIAYDLVLDTVCDLNCEAECGFSSTMELYFCCALVGPDRAADRAGAAGAPGAAPEQAELLRIPQNTVPVPIKAGGLIGAVVLLANKTAIPGDLWLQKNPFFAIRYV